MRIFVHSFKWWLILSLPIFAGSFNGIAIRVNGRIVTKGEINRMLDPIKELATSRASEGTPAYVKMVKEAKAKIVEELIARELILYEFNKLGGSIPEHIITNEINHKIREEYEGDEYSLREDLKNQGLSFMRYREKVKRQIRAQAMRSQNIPAIAPATPSEMRKEYYVIKEKLRDVQQDVCDFEKMYILKSDETDPKVTAKSGKILTDNIVANLNKGVSFAKLAKKHSSDAFAEEGGLQTNINRGDLSPVIAMILFEEPVGKVVGPLEDQNGFHIIKVKAKRLGPSPPYLDSKVQELLRGRVKQAKAKGYYDRWIKDLKKDAIIKYN